MSAQHIPRRDDSISQPRTTTPPLPLKHTYLPPRRDKHVKEDTDDRVALLQRLAALSHLQPAVPAAAATAAGTGGAARVDDRLKLPDTVVLELQLCLFCLICAMIKGKVQS